ncbi:hypothetical protein TL16_g05998 [Triparma laevis f. inornata]|uniref:Uncharacterized protein n=1 Tax=Triparma laevis f. inornata TaxID=1714386 RepID=A0A9W7ARR6_9STRA|nr:hypothetical protein TL16_g05998 [Triparma laevis f. inornata]
MLPHLAGVPVGWKVDLTLTGADEEAKFAGLTEAFQKQDTSRHGRLLKQIRDKFTTMSKKLGEQNHVEETSVDTFLGVEPDDVTGMRTLDEVTKKLLIDIHEEPNKFLESILGNNRENPPKGKLQQLVLEKVSKTEQVVYWSSRESDKSSFDLVLRLKISDGTREDGPGSKIINVNSIKEEEFDPSWSDYMEDDKHPHRMIIHQGFMKLVPEKYRQTRLIMCGKIFLQNNVASPLQQENNILKVGRSKSSYFLKKGFSMVGVHTGVAARPSGLSISSDIINEAEFFQPARVADASAFKRFNSIGIMFYERFKKEDEIDERMKEDFLENEMENPPQQSKQTVALIDRSISLLKEMDSAKRVAGTFNSRVEKFTLWKEGEPSAWGKTVCSVDTSAKRMFAHLRVLDTFKRKRDHKKSNGSLPRGVWENLGGVRILQFSTCVKFPSGFHNRLFETWLTWAKREAEDGKAMYIMAFAPLSEYVGPRYKVLGSEEMTMGMIRGVHVVKEVTTNTCEWTKVQNVDLHMSLPKVILDHLAKNELNLTHMIQESFRRNGKGVDQELRRANGETMHKMRGRALAKDQQEVFDRCQELGKDDEGWLVTESPYEDVDLWMKDVQHRKVDAPMTIGRVQGIVDCSVEEMASWVMDFCSNERMRVSTKVGSEIARHMLSDHAMPNENTAAVVKRTPLFFKSQEFVVRQIWKSEEDSVTLALESCDDSVLVDYGFKANTTKGFTRGYWKIAKLPDRGGAAQCRATLYMLVVDNGRSLPTWLVKRKPPATLGAVQGAINLFRKDELVDDADRMELANFIRKKHAEQEYSGEELDMISRVKALFEKGAKWGELVSPDLFVKMEYSTWQPDDDKSTIHQFRGSTVIDDTLEDCAAWEMKKMTRERNRGYRSFGGLERHVVPLNSHSEMYHAVYETGVASFVPREWLLKVVWKKESDRELYVVYEDMEHPDFPINDAYHIRVKTAMLWKYERLPSKEGFPQTKVTYCQQLDMRGQMPNFIMNSRAVGTLAILMGMRRKFDQSDEIDQSRRNNLSVMISELPSNKWNREMEYFQALSSKRKNATRPAKSFGLSKGNKMASKILGGVGWGVTNVDIRTSLDEAAAFFFDFSSRAYQEIAGDIERLAKRLDFDIDAKDGTCLRRMVKRRVKLKKSRTQITVPEKKFFNEVVVRRIDADNILVMMLPVTEEQYSKKDEEAANLETFSKGWQQARGNWKRKRTFLASSLPTVGQVIDYENRAATAKMKFFIKLHKRSDNVTNANFAMEVELGTGAKPKAITQLVCDCLDEISAISVYFQRRVNLRDMDRDDGEALGHDLLWKAASAKQRLKRFEEVLKRSHALKQVVRTVGRFAWFPTTMREILKGDLYLNYPVDTKMVCLDEDEAGQIGRNLIPALRSKKKVEAGIDQWRVQNRAAREFLEDNPWFQTTLKIVSKGVVRTAPWGLFWRVTVGAVLSVADLLTDVNVARQYHEDGRHNYRNMCIVSILAAMFLQLVLVFSQHKHQGFFRVMREGFWVLTGLKTTADAYRVATAQQKEHGSMMDPLEEMTYSKCIEIFAEAIPGILIQMKSMLELPEVGEGGEGDSEFFGSKNVALLVSIGISALTVGFTSGQISYDYDSDPERRDKSPEFYGFIPDSKTKRLYLFCTMVMTPAFMVLIKSMAITLLFLYDPVVLVVYYWGIEMSVFLLVKWLRNDLSLWIRVEGFTRPFVTVLVRIACKILTDFTGIVQLRYPLDLGGLTWTISSIISLLSLAAAIMLHESKDNGVLLFPGMQMVWSVGWVLVGLYVAGFIIFFALINKGYAKTFWSTKTASEYLHDKFISHPHDEARAEIFNISPHLWRHMKLEVKAWVSSHWEGWMDLKPAWLTDEIISMIPEDMVPSEEERVKVRKMRQMLNLQREMLGMDEGIAEGDEEEESDSDDDGGERRTSSGRSSRRQDRFASQFLGRRVSKFFGGHAAIRAADEFNTAGMNSVLPEEKGSMDPGDKNKNWSARERSILLLNKQRAAKGKAELSVRNKVNVKRGRKSITRKKSFFGGIGMSLGLGGRSTPSADELNKTIKLKNVEGAMIVPMISGSLPLEREISESVEEFGELEEGDWELMEELQKSAMKRRAQKVSFLNI